MRPAVENMHSTFQMTVWRGWQNKIWRLIRLLAVAQGTSSSHEHHLGTGQNESSMPLAFNINNNSMKYRAFTENKKFLWN